ncbi:unnamed protein product [Didymodactylos carnosus]|uniref:UBC core domain-containing protein n=1 Tax=Didymodactylos carnosus TaxID=1234261 RepID=A0A813UBV0_9BILA|nr:unnamed protein product [Didymodactylos carnosus]CAF3606965.1 unnamed protein product [Didymodactylos carnosus]
MAESKSVQRLRQELNDLLANALEFVTDLEVVEDDPYHWKGKMIGPPDTPYTGGTFEFEITFTQWSILYERLQKI